MIEKKYFGKTPEGREVYTYTLNNGSGVVPVISDLGGTIVNLFVKDKNGAVTDVVCGFDKAEDYFTAYGYQGAIIGRVCNRICNSKYTLNGVEYTLYANDGPHSAHGGKVGFNKRVWDVIETSDGEEPFIVLKYVSPDMEENFPGNLTVYVTYTLIREGGISIRYEAETDKDTLINLTNHSYFNLGGCGSGSIKDHILWVNSDKINEQDYEYIPTGNFTNVAGTVYDFNKPKPVGRDFDSKDMDKQLGGYDNNYIVKNYDGSIKLVATLENPLNNIKLSVLTNQPCVQVYTSNLIVEEDIPFKGGKPQKKRCAVCFETQHMPDSINHPNFTNTVLKPGEKYDFTTIYKFN
ncbi:MAG: galactose mutarotase [Clostridia bacterium]|nr:galactose mutarotase [Clostridia bacterium]